MFLRNELLTDPLGRGYAGMTDQQAADSLNTRNRPLDAVPAEEIARYILEEGKWPAVEDQATAVGATTQQKYAARSALAAFRDARLPTLRVSRAKVGAMLDLLVSGGALNAADKAAIVALGQNRLTRGEEIGHGRVKVGHVIEARA